MSTRFCDEALASRTTTTYGIATWPWACIDLFKPANSYINVGQYRYWNIEGYFRTPGSSIEALTLDTTALPSLYQPNTISHCRPSAFSFGTVLIPLRVLHGSSSLVQTHSARVEVDPATGTIYCGRLESS